MSFTVTKVDIWSSKIEDKPGGLAKVLGALGNAGANLDCVVARRDPRSPAPGLCFTPVKGSAVRKAAQSGGSGARRERRDAEGRRGRRGRFGRSDSYSNCRRRNKFAWCFRRGDRQEVCGIPRFRQRCGRDKSDLRIEDLGRVRRKPEKPSADNRTLLEKGSRRLNASCAQA